MRVFEGFWKNAVWIDFCNRRKANWSNVMYFANQYEKILKFSEDEHDKLYEEFIDFNIFSDLEIDLNQAILKEYDSGTKEYRMDII